jgi:hypothetical protein
MYYYLNYGITFGNALAIAMSWSTNHSVIWSVIDGFLSWIYVIYYVLMHLTP